MASPKRLREFRFRSGTTLNQTYLDADSVSWNPSDGDTTKLRTTGYDDSGMVDQFSPDPTQEQRHFAKRAPIKTTSRGTFSLDVPLGGGGADNTAPAEASFLAKSLGNIQAAAKADRTYAVSDASGASTTSKIYAVDIDDEAIGQGVLINGESRSIKAKGTNYIELTMALGAIPTDGDDIVIATTVYADAEAAQQYIDTLAIGLAAEDQRQSLGAIATGITLSGIAPGNLPMIKYAFGCADQRKVPADQLDQLEPTAAASGNGFPPGFGGCFLGDFGSTTRNVFRTGDLSASIGPKYGEIPNQNLLSGFGGWQKEDQEISAGFKIIADEDAGLEADAIAKTKKQLMVQFGTVARDCVAVELQRCHLNGTPKSDSLNGFQAYACEMMADEGTDTTNQQTYSPCRIHFF